MAGYIPYDQSTSYTPKKKDEKPELPPPGGAFRATGGANVVQSTGAVDTYKGLFEPNFEPGQARTAGNYLIGFGKNLGAYFDETSRRFGGSRNPQPATPPAAEEADPAVTDDPAKTDEPKADEQSPAGTDPAATGTDPAATGATQPPSLPDAYRVGTNAFVTGAGNEFGDAGYLASRGIAVPEGGVEGEADKTSSLKLGSVSYGEEGDSAYAMDQFRKALEIRKQMAGNDPRSKAERLLKRLPYGEIGDRRKRESMLAAAGLYLNADATDKTSQAALLSAQNEAENNDRQALLDTIEAGKPEFQTIKDENGNEMMIQINPDGTRQVFNPGAYQERLAQLQDAQENGDITPEEYQERLTQLNHFYGR